MTGQTHSMSILKNAINEVADRGRKVIDTRTRVGKALMAWRAQLVADLGGAEQLSTQQQALVDISMRTKLLLDTIDHWLLRQPSLIDKRRRQLYPVVAQRTALADALARYLGLLGLSRVAREARLSDYLKAGRAMTCSPWESMSPLSSTLSDQNTCIRSCG
jgi:hypothetical protein